MIYLEVSPWVLYIMCICIFVINIHLFIHIYTFASSYSSHHPRWMELIAQLEANFAGKVNWQVPFRIKCVMPNWQPGWLSHLTTDPIEFPDVSCGEFQALTHSFHFLVAVKSLNGFFFVFHMTKPTLLATSVVTYLKKWPRPNLKKNYFSSDLEVGLVSNGIEFLLSHCRKKANFK